MAHRSDRSDDIQVVDLPGARLMAAGDVGDVDVADLRDAARDAGDEVPLGDLLVVDGEEKVEYARTPSGTTA